MSDLGRDPGDLIPVELWDREFLPQDDATVFAETDDRPDELADRADCGECDGDGEVINHSFLTGDQRLERCDACLGTGTERTRDEPVSYTHLTLPTILRV